MSYLNGVVSILMLLLLGCALIAYKNGKGKFKSFLFTLITFELLFVFFALFYF
ncbi:Uncharacterised protein [Listeria ivanovii subsp. londoniensis]|uniref:Uncharacterized protein n=1 Tax=Listeria ivanovii TaxID=1638 RepID=A0AAX2DQH0_LISIV|nr:hypothetical protein SAMN05421782_10825 [Listeria ivanovii]VEH44760.1 Uncharacterised protein [Listeria ivanovii subsp. londoniensis]